jgi:hypothetical protein
MGSDMGLWDKSRGLDLCHLATAIAVQNLPNSRFRCRTLVGDEKSMTRPSLPGNQPVASRSSHRFIALTMHPDLVPRHITTRQLNHSAKRALTSHKQVEAGVR